MQQEGRDGTEGLAVFCTLTDWAAFFLLVL